MTSEIRINALKNRVGLGTITFTNTGPVVSGIVTAREGVFIPDNKKIELGNTSGSGDIALYHNGTDAYIDNDTGGLRINTASDEVQINKATNEYMARFITDGAVELYHNNVKKMETTSSGADFSLSSGGQVNLYHLGSDGGLRISGPQSASSATLFFNTNHQNVSGGTDYYTITCGGANHTLMFKRGDMSGTTVLELDDTQHVRIPQDGKALKFGAGQDLQLYHSGSHSYIDNKTGNLYIRANTDGDVGGDIHIRPKSGENSLSCLDDGSVKLYFDNSEKLATKSTGVLISNQGNNRILDVHHTNGTSAYVAFLDQNTTDNAAVRVGAEGNNFKIFAGSYERLRIRSNGHIAVGSQAIASGVVSGGIALMMSKSDGARIKLCRDASGVGSNDGFELTMANDDKAYIWNRENADMLFGTNGTERLRIRSTGEVSLGNVDSSSSSALHIRSVTNTETTLELSTKSNYNGSLPSAKISFTQQNGTEIARIKCDTTTGAANMADLTFWTNYGGLYERLRITKTGEVGIGNRTTSPDGNLHVHTASGDSVLHVEAAADPKLRLRAHSGESIVQFADASSSNIGEINYVHSGDYLKFQVNSNERLRITSTGNVGINQTSPQTELNVIGSISTGRNVAKELGTIINISSNHNAPRSGGNVISGHKNYESGSQDWLAAGGARVNANLTIDLGTVISCDRFVIYNQNEYSTSHREVKRFTLEGSNDNSSWTTILDDNAGCSNGHEPNPGWSFRIPADRKDDEEGKSYRYWRFTMKDFHGSDSYGGVTELELYQTGTSSNSDHVGSEISTHSLVATDVSAEIVRTTGQPAFSVARTSTFPSSGNYSANTTIVFDDDTGGGFFQTGTSPHASYYNTSNGLFTAPMSGIYFFTTTVLVQNSTGNYDLIIKTTPRDFYCAPGRKASNPGSTSWSTSGTVYLAFGGDCIVYLKKGETAEVRFTTFGGGQIYGSGSWTRFAGYLLG